MRPRSGRRRRAPRSTRPPRTSCPSRTGPVLEARRLGEGRADEGPDPSPEAPCQCLPPDGARGAAGRDQPCRIRVPILEAGIHSERAILPGLVCGGHRPVCGRVHRSHFSSSIPGVRNAFGPARRAAGRRPLDYPGKPRHAHDMVGDDAWTDRNPERPAGHRVPIEDPRPGTPQTCPSSDRRVGHRLANLSQAITRWNESSGTGSTST